MFDRQVNHTLGGPCKHAFNCYWIKNQSQYFSNLTPKFDVVIRRVNGLEFFILSKCF